MAVKWNLCIMLTALGVLFLSNPAVHAGADGVRLHDGSSRTFTIQRVNVSGTGEEADGYSSNPAISASGRYVAFASGAANLVAGDTNDDYDIFMHDRVSGSTIRLSESWTGGDTNGPSDYPAVSGNGRLVAFMSEANNLHPDDPDRRDDIFVHDVMTGITLLASVNSDGEKSNWYCEEPRLSGNGAFVCWSSSATNLVPGDVGFDQDIFLRDIPAGTTEMISTNAAGEQGNDESYFPAVSHNGRFVAFESSSTNLVPGGTSGRTLLFLKDRLTGTVTLVSKGLGNQEPDDDCWNAVISGNGRYVGYLTFASNIVPDDNNGTADVFVWDQLLDTTMRASVSSGGEEGNGEANFPALSGNGSLVAFSSEADNLVPGDTNEMLDVFVHSLTMGWTVRVSVGEGGVEGDGLAVTPALAANNRHAAFFSTSTNLVPGDTNEKGDIFAVGRR